MDLKKSLVTSTYYYLISINNERTLVYCYINPDTSLLSFGFNVADGGGCMPCYDVSDDTIIVEADIKGGVISSNHGDLWSIVDDQDTEVMFGRREYCTELLDVLMNSVSSISKEQGDKFKHEIRTIKWSGDLRLIPFNN